MRVPARLVAPQDIPTIGLAFCRKFVAVLIAVIFRDQGFGWIDDPTDEGGICGLGATNRGKGNEEEDEERGAGAHAVK